MRGGRVVPRIGIVEGEFPGVMPTELPIRIRLAIHIEGQNVDSSLNISGAGDRRGRSKERSRRAVFGPEFIFAERIPDVAGSLPPGESRLHSRLGLIGRAGTFVLRDVQD